MVTPEGLNYERKAIEKHITQNSKDPKTGLALEKDELIPNIALKELMKVFKEGKWGSKVCNG